MFGAWIFSIILSFSSITYAAQKNNKKWVINTPSPTLSKQVKKIIKNNKNLDPAELESVISQNLKSERYLTAKIYIDSEENKITISNIQKYLILFEGNINHSNGSIKSAIDLNNLISSEDTIKDDILLRIKQYYTKSGYNDIKIEVKETPFPKSNLIRLVFKIDEGQVYSLDKITINGSFSKKKRYYINYLKNKSSKLIKSGKFSKTDLENGLNNLITHLKNSGYLEATYSGLRIEKRKGFSNKVHIYFDLYEGLPTRISNIRFIGNKNVDADWLSVLLGFKEKDILDFNKLEKGVQSIFEYYLSTGYLDIQINPNNKDLVELNTEKRRSDIVIELIEGEKVLVGKIQITGLKKTQEYVVKNIIDFELGDVLTIAKIKSSKRKLNLSGIFSKVDIEFDESYEDNVARVIKVNLEERKPGVVQLGFGARFNQKALAIKGYAGVLYKNLGGTARAVNTRLELQSRLNEQAYPEHRAFISYYEPFIFDKRIRGRASINSTENIYEIKIPTVTLFRSFGADFTIENNFNQNVKISWTLLGLNFNKEYQINGPSNTEIREDIGYFGPTFQLDYRNNIFLPTGGYFLRTQAEYGFPNFRLFDSMDLGTRINAKGLSTDLRYVRTEATYTKYSSLRENLILVNTLRGGWLKNLSDGTFRYPKSRAFFLGGSSTIRGFDPSDGVNERIPSDEDLKNFLDTTGSVVSGAGGGSVLSIPGNSYFYLLKAELRFPVMYGFWGSVFYDGGSVLIDNITMKDPYRDAAGFGLRYNTPIGALTVDVGFKLDRDKSRGESPGRVHINIGTF